MTLAEVMLKPATVVPRRKPLPASATRLGALVTDAGGGTKGPRQRLLPPGKGGLQHIECAEAHTNWLSEAVSSRCTG